MRLKADDVVPMRVPPEVTLDVEGIPVYRGTYGTVGETRAVKVQGPALRS